MINRELKRKLILQFVPRLIWLFMWILYLICRNRFFIDKNITDKNLIFVFWHGEFLMLPFLYKKIRKKPKVFIVASEHFDGEIAARVYECFGFNMIRGSSSSGGMRVLVQAISRLKDGNDAALTPDGPRGPYHSVADGVVAMAQKTSLNVVALHTRPSRFWQLNTWDKFKIPKPFCTIRYYALQPFRIDSALSIDEAKELVLKEMSKDLL